MMKLLFVPEAETLPPIPGVMLLFVPETLFLVTDVKLFPIPGGVKLSGSCCDASGGENGNDG